MSPKQRDQLRGDGTAEEWIFPFEAELHAVAPGLHDAQSAWMAQIDSLRAPDRKTHELIRMVCTVIRRNPPGVTRHAMLAAEVGATWEEVAGSVVLTEPAFGLLNVVEALPWARRGWEQGRRRSPEAKDAGVGTRRTKGASDGAHKAKGAADGVGKAKGATKSAAKRPAKGAVKGAVKGAKRVERPAKARRR